MKAREKWETVGAGEEKKVRETQEKADFIVMGAEVDVLIIQPTLLTLTSVTSCH